MKKPRVGVIGLGNRGTALLTTCLLQDDGIEIAMICDTLEERRAQWLSLIAEAGRSTPVAVSDYKELLASPDIDCVMLTTSWDSHINLACEAMRAGKYVAMEVGGAYSIEDCWKLVRTHEETGVHCMFMENCCFFRNEMLILNMAQQGVFGDIVHCRGGYLHDLRDEVAFGRENHHYRFRNYLMRNAENYPTHQLGPIAQLLGVNRGNRMLTLVSVASRAAGLRAYLEEHKGADYDATKWDFRQGDIVTTIIKCAGGETITLTLDTTLPRSYSRDFQVHGTKAMYNEDNNSLFVDKEHGDFHFDWRGHWNNLDDYRDKYEHPLWKEYIAQGQKEGHDGSDWLVLQTFFDAVRKGAPAPIDVYDAAVWMSITCLSEQSISMGGTPMAIPDFTNGKWLRERECRFS